MATKKGAEATGASKKFPSLKEDVVKGVKQDVEKIGKVRTTTAKGAAKQSVQTAAKRAAGRMAGRGGLVGTALAAGLVVGDRIAKSLPSGAPVDRNPSGRADKIPGQSFKQKETPKPKTAPAKAPQAKEEDVVKPESTPTRKKFSNAFGRARKAGKKEFDFQGKRFNTKLKK